jgi:hypothetical protein
MKVRVILIFILLALSSCRELVQDEFPDFEQVPVINSILVAGEPVIVHVSLTGKLDTNRLALVNNAEVLLSVDGQFRERLTYSEKGIYLSTVVAEQGRKYGCVVNVPDFKTVTCSDSIPAAAVLSDISYIEKAGKNEEGSTYQAVKFTFTNNSESRQYYEVIIHLVSQRFEKQAYLEKITDRLILNEGLPIALFSNSLINGSSYTMTINFSSGEDSSINGQPQSDLYPVVIELRSVSSEYYKFMKQKYLYDKGRYPEFMAASVSSFPIYSNVKNGYGIFGGYSLVKSSTIYP